MFTWEDMKSGFRSAVNKVISKTDALAEEASLSIKKKTAEVHLTEAYEKLGRLVYRFRAEIAENGAEIRLNEQLHAAFREVEKYRKEVSDADAAIKGFKETSKKDGKAPTDGSGEAASETAEDSE